MLPAGFLLLQQLLEHLLRPLLRAKLGSWVAAGAHSSPVPRAIQVVSSFVGLVELLQFQHMGTVLQRSSL